MANANAHNLYLRETGAGNRSSVRHTVSCNLQANNSAYVIKHAVHMRMTVEGCHVYAVHSTNSSVSGTGNTIQSRHMTNGTVTGNETSLTAAHTTNLTLSGSNCKCQLEHETNHQLTGNQNQVNAKSNTNLVLSGNGNFVIAEKNTNLVVKGNSSRIVAVQTTNISVEGDQNQVLIRETWVPHRIKRIFSTSSDTPENRVDFTKSNSYICNGIDYNVNCGGITTISNGGVTTIYNGGVTTICNGVIFCNSNGGSTRKTVLPHLNVSYLDRASVIKNDYIVGLFHFELDLMEEANNNEVSVTIMQDQWDQGSLTSADMSETGTFVIITGVKDGVSQKLRLTGPHIANYMDGENAVPFKYIINLDP